MLFPATQADDLRDCEEALAAGLVQVATELRLIDVVELITLIQNEQVNIIRQLISVACECYYDAGLFNYCSTADVSVQWGRAPTIYLDMSLSTEKLLIHFTLSLQSGSAAVEISHKMFKGCECREVTSSDISEALAKYRMN